MFKLMHVCMNVYVYFCFEVIVYPFSLHWHYVNPDCLLFPSDSGEQVLLVTSELEFHLWELKDGNCPQWWKLIVPEGLTLPSGYRARETAIDACFFVHQARH